MSPGVEVTRLSATDLGVDLAHTEPWRCQSNSVRCFPAQCIAAFSCTVFRCSRNFVSIVTMKKTYCLIVVNTVDRQAGFTVTVTATAQGRGRARLSFPIPGEAL